MVRFMLGFQPLKVESIGIAGTLGGEEEKQK